MISRAIASAESLANGIRIVTYTDTGNTMLPDTLDYEYRIRILFQWSRRNNEKWRDPGTTDEHQQTPREGET